MNQIQEQDQTPKTGYIYAIKSHLTTDIYIGSTSKNINKRYIDHKAHYKIYLKDPLNCRSKCRSFEILKYDDHYIELLENVSYIDKKQLNIREGHHIVQNIENIVNKNIAGRTIQEFEIARRQRPDRIQYKKEYEKRPERKKYQKEYRNTPEYKQYKKEYQIEYRKRKKALKNGTTSNTPEPESQDEPNSN